MTKRRVQVTAGAALFYPLLLFLDTDGWLCAILPGVLCHELGHLAALRACGGQVKHIQLEAAGLRMDVTPFTSAAQEMLCAAAGPTAGFLWAFVSKSLNTVWSVRSSAAAVVINGFNLLPALPLDGGLILFALTRNRSLTLFFSWATAAALAAAFYKWKAWGLLVPAALIIKIAVNS